MDEHQRAIEYDLIALGLRLRWLGSELLTWGDLMSIVQNLPTTSALNIARYGQDTMWGLNEYLSAGIFNQLAIANWQRAGDEKAKRPTPILAPGMEAAEEDKTTYGSGAVTIEEFHKFWDS